MSNLVAFNKAYHGYLIEFMAFLHPDADYDATSVFGVDVLSQIRPEDIVQWLNIKAYGDRDPPPLLQPLKGRANSLGQYKKALSYYLRGLDSDSWNERAQKGNPTRSAKVNNVIKQVKKAEVRKLGKPTAAVRPLECAEFEWTMSQLMQSDDIKKKYMVSAAAKFQFHLIGRLDDTCRFEECDLKPNPQFPFALVAKMCWSKNVREERESPDQIVLGAMDFRYCVLLALGMYLEVWHQARRGAQKPFLFGSSDNPQRTKDYIYHTLSKLWDSPDFVPMAEGKVGTHSFRKFPSTYARRNGASQDDVENRGRWKRARVVNVYIDVNLPYPDAKVAGILCVGGPCAYVLREGCGISDEWLATHVVPSLALRSRISPKVSLVLAKPVLWACFDPRLESFVHEGIRMRVRQEYQRIRVLEADVNPVERVSLIITGYESEVHIDEIVGLEDLIDAASQDGEQQGTNDTGASGATRRASNNNARSVLSSSVEHFRALYSQSMAMRRELQQLRSNIEEFRDSNREYMSRMNTNISRIAIQPGRALGFRGAVAAVAAGGATAAGVNNNGGENTAVLVPPAAQHLPFAAVLTRTPRDLHILWMEYEFGIGGRKAARLFTPAERGACKYKYHRRKVVWDKIMELIRTGHTAQTAIDAIYDVYGQHRTVTAIINEMRRERDRVL